MKIVYFDNLIAMKKALKVWMLLMLLASCGNKSSQGSDSGAMAVAEQWDISLRVIDLQMHNPRYEAIVHNSSDGTKQVLEGYTSDYPQEMLASFGNVLQTDVNFDGYTDVMICLGMMPTSNQPVTFYDAWLYDPQKDKFVLHKNFRYLCNPEVDNAHQYVLCHVVRPDGKTKRYTAYTIRTDGTVKKLREWQEAAE